MTALQVALRDGFPPEPEWWALWAADPGATPFNSPDWLIPWWAVFGQEPLLVVEARQDGRLAGLLPVYPCGSTLLPVGVGVSDYLDALVRPGVDGVAAALLESLGQAAGRRPCAVPGLPAGSPLRTAAAPGWQPAADHDCAPVIDMAAPVPKAKLRTVLQGRRRAEALGPVELRSAEAGTLPAMVDALVRLHGARWEAGGVFGDADAERFHRLALPRLLASGLLRLFLLTIAGRPAAVYYGMAAKGRAYAYLGGFDPAFSREGAASLVLLHALEDARRDGAREFHFLRGREPYKYSWGATDRLTAVRRWPAT